MDFNPALPLLTGTKRCRKISLKLLRSNFSQRGRCFLATKDLKHYMQRLAKAVIMLRSRVWSFWDYVRLYGMRYDLYELHKHLSARLSLWTADKFKFDSLLTMYFLSVNYWKNAGRFIFGRIGCSKTKPRRAMEGRNTNRGGDLKH